MCLTKLNRVIAEQDRIGTQLTSVVDEQSSMQNDLRLLTESVELLVENAEEAVGENSRQTSARRQTRMSRAAGARQSGWAPGTVTA